MSIARHMAIILALLGLGACAPVHGAYGESHGWGYPSAIYSGGLYGGAMQGGEYERIYDSQIREAQRDAYLRGLRAAERSNLRDAELRRQLDRARRAERLSERHERRLDWAERERRHARWMDRDPVRTGPFDRADSDRRRAEFLERRARAERGLAERRADRARDRLDRLDRADRIQDRIDRIERMQRRHEARRAPGQRQIGGVERQVSESRENYENRARRVIERRRQGESVDSLTRDHE